MNNILVGGFDVIAFFDVVSHQLLVRHSVRQVISFTVDFIWDAKSHSLSRQTGRWRNPVLSSWLGWSNLGVKTVLIRFKGIAQLVQHLLNVSDHWRDCTVIKVTWLEHRLHGGSGHGRHDVTHLFVDCVAILVFWSLKWRDVNRLEKSEWWLWQGTWGHC